MSFDIRGGYSAGRFSIDQLMWVLSLRPTDSLLEYCVYWILRFWPINREALATAVNSLHHNFMHRSASNVKRVYLQAGSSRRRINRKFTNRIEFVVLCFALFFGCFQQKTRCASFDRTTNRNGSARVFFCSVSQISISVQAEYTAATAVNWFFAMLGDSISAHQIAFGHFEFPTNEILYEFL